MSNFNEETLNKLVRDSINRITGIDGFAIRANQNAPRPKGTHATVGITSVSGVAWEQSEYIYDDQNDTLDQNISTPRTVLITINVYRSNARIMAENIRTGFVRQSILEFLGAGGTGLSTRSPVTSTTEALESGWEDRATFSVSLNIVVTDTDSVQFIESANMQNVYESSGGNTTNISIEVKQ